jgi:transposase
MRPSPRAGEALFVDEAGQKGPVVDLRSGEVHEASRFLAVLGAAHSPLAEAPWSPSLPAWLGSQGRAFAARGGVPQVRVPANLKAAVSRSHRSEPERNRTYAALAQP